METTPRITDAVERLKIVFAEVPGTQLSLADASRLAGLERTTCRVLLEALADARFLARGRNGLFVRRTSDSPMA
jgi:DNA-binding IclR family transcriptional regulator